MFLVIAQLPPMPPMPGFIFWENVILPLAGMALAVILGLPIIRAVVRRIERKGSEASVAELSALRAEVADLRARLEGGEHLGERLIELEERLDFTERMLTRQRAPDRLPERT